MNKMTISKFEALPVKQLQDLLPVIVTSYGKDLFIADKVGANKNVTPPDQYSDDQLVKLMLGADTDPVHITDAKVKISKWKLANNMSVPNVTPEAPGKVTTMPPKALPNDTIVTKPYWLGEWTQDVKSFTRDICASTNDTKLFVLYNIPGRDNGNESAGGVSSASEYMKWINDVQAGIGNSKAICILEPDALGLSRDIPVAKAQERYAMMSKAVTALKANPNTKVYVDSSIWPGVDESARLLMQVPGADGFSCNVSGYLDQATCTAYAEGVSAKTGLHYIIDTSRNGNGAPHGADIWQNQTDTKVGLPNMIQPSERCDAYLWIKVPGESDGRKINGKDNDGKPLTFAPAGTMVPELRDALYSGNWGEFKRKYNV